LRLWPGLIIAAALWLTRIGAPVADTATEFLIRVLGGIVGAFAALVWWVGFSGASWRDRVTSLVALAAAVAGTWALGHPSMLVWLLWYAPALLTLALVAGAAAGRGLGDRARRVVMAVAIVLPCAAAMPFRVAGVAGNGVAAFEWRWTETSEQRLLSRVDEEPAAAGLRDRHAGARRDVVSSSPPPPPKDDPAAASKDTVTSVPRVVAASEPAHTPEFMWAGFRGAERNSTLAGVRIETDWGASAPVLMWRRPVGPVGRRSPSGVTSSTPRSSEGPDEVVSAYTVLTGEPVCGGTAIRRGSRIRWAVPVHEPRRHLVPTAYTRSDRRGSSTPSTPPRARPLVARCGKRSERRRPHVGLLELAAPRR
jgi:hypothetical protein